MNHSLLGTSMLHVLGARSPLSGGIPMRCTLVPFAAVLLMAGCSDAPTALSPDAPLFTEHEAPLGPPHAAFDLSATECIWNADDTVDCRFRLTDFQNIPEEAEILVRTYISFDGTYVCVNSKNGRVQAKSGGSFSEQVLEEIFSFTNFVSDIEGGVTLTATVSLPKDYCGKPANLVPQIDTVNPISMGVNAEIVVHVEDGERRIEIAGPNYVYMTNEGEEGEWVLVRTGEAEK